MSDHLQDLDYEEIVSDRVKSCASENELRRKTPIEVLEDYTKEYKRSRHTGGIAMKNAKRMLVEVYAIFIVLGFVENKMLNAEEIVNLDKLDIVSCENCKSDGRQFQYGSPCYWCTVNWHLFNHFEKKKE